MKYSIRQVVKTEQVFEFTIEASSADEAQTKAGAMRVSSDPRYLLSQTGTIVSDVVLMAEERDK